MAIGEGKATSTIVQRGREIAPAAFRIWRIPDHAVVDAVGVFVDGQIDIGRVRNGAELNELFVPGREESRVSVWTGHKSAGVTDKAIH